MWVLFSLLPITVFLTCKKKHFFKTSRVVSFNNPKYLPRKILKKKKYFYCIKILILVIFANKVHITKNLIILLKKGTQVKAIIGLVAEEEKMSTNSFQDLRNVILKFLIRLVSFSISCSTETD